MNITQMMAMKWGIILGTAAVARKLSDREPKKNYIKLVDRQYPDDNNAAFFYGPFDKGEIKTRLKDQFAKHVQSEGDWGPGYDVETIKLSDMDVADRIFVNPKETWMYTLRQLEAKFPKQHGLIWRALPFTPWC